MTAAMALLGQLPGPPSKANQGACGVLDGDVFAYAVSSSVAVLDVSAADLASCDTLAANFVTLQGQVLPQRQLAHLQSSNRALGAGEDLAAGSGAARSPQIFSCHCHQLVGGPDC